MCAAFAGSIPAEWSAKINGSSGFYDVDVSDNPCICGALPAWWPALETAFYDYSYGDTADHLTASKLWRRAASTKHLATCLYYPSTTVLLNLTYYCRACSLAVLLLLLPLSFCTADTMIPTDCSTPCAAQPPSPPSPSSSSPLSSPSPPSQSSPAMPFCTANPSVPVCASGDSNGGCRNRHN